MEKLLTIASISRELSIPESTLRYRAKMFKDFLPIKGTGRKKRFYEACLDRFAFIDECFNKGMVADDIRGELEGKYVQEVVAEVAGSKGKVEAKVKENSLATNELVVEMKEIIAPLMKVIQNQEVIIQELKKQNEMLLEAPKKQGFFAKIFS